MRKNKWSCFTAVLGYFLAFLPMAWSGFVTITPIRDTTIYQDVDNANGAGTYLFAGNSAVGESRRALLAFDTSNIPLGAVITDASLQLRVSRVPPFLSGSHSFFLNRATADWGEAGSDAPNQEGTGAPAETGDATWNHAFYDSVFWATSGGDYMSSSTAYSVGGLGTYSFSSLEMVNDIQFWLTQPTHNYGWFLLGEEMANGSAAIGTARRFNSSSDPDSQPKLFITYEIPEPQTGAIMTLGVMGLGLFLRVRQAKLAYFSS